MPLLPPATTHSTLSPVLPALSRRHLRRLLVELMAIAAATRGKDDFPLDLSPVGADFDPEAVV